MDNARDADLRMAFKDMGYEERRAMRKNKSLVQSHLALSRGGVEILNTSSII
jgi:hypothetical protein